MLSAIISGIDGVILQQPGAVAFIEQSIERCNKLRGDMAEVGVFAGGSAQVIAKNTKKDIHLYDTFAGLPEEEGMFKRGDYPADYETVRFLMRKYPNVFIHKGIFPETAEPFGHLDYCFVHIDCDLSKYVYKALEFFFPKLVDGGIIIVHDISNTNVSSAVRKYFYGQAKRKKDIKGGADQLGFYKVRNG